VNQNLIDHQNTFTGLSNNEITFITKE